VQSRDEPAQSPSAEDPPGAYSSDEKAISLGVALVLLASVVAAIVIFGGANQGDDRGGSAAADGVLVRVEPGRLRLRLARPVEGQREIDFVVRPQDQAALDITHLQLHASDGLPTRIYYERVGDQYVARRAEDLPALR